MEDKYKQFCCDRLSDILQDLICDDGAEAAAQVIGETIDSWLEYHETAAAEWKKLKTILHL